MELEGNDSIFGKMQNGIDVSAFSMNKSTFPRVNGNTKMKPDIMPLPSH